MGWFDLEYKTEAIKAMIARKKYEDALEMAGGVNWKRVKDVKLMCTVSDLYKMNRQFAESKELLLAANKRKPGDKNVIFALCEICIRMERTAEAQDYCEEYAYLAPESSNYHVLRYKLAVATEKGLEEKIAILEELREAESVAKWRLELAKLYYAAKMPDKCKAECDAIAEEFSESKFAAKALELKNRLG